MSDKVIELLGEALNLEKEGERYYTEAIEKVSNSFSKTLLQRLANDEVDHAVMIVKLLKKVKGESSDSINLESFRDYSLKIFPNDAETIRKEVAGDEASLQVLRIAIEKEEGASNLYASLLKETNDQELKEILTCLVNVEKQHKDLLVDYLNFLEEPVSGWDSLERWASQS